MNYYNEFDKFPAEWLRGLMSAGEIPQGDVDERSITDVQATDLLGYRQCHFFAGIGGWARALRLAGIADDANVDTASLPCQPFSTAGLQKGEQDERHLWPIYFGLLQQRRPELAFGEQVSAAIRLGWIDRVQADLEAAGYSFGFVVLGAHSVGAPHIRQRIFWGAKRISDAGSTTSGRNSRGLPATETGIGGSRKFNGNQLDGFGDGRGGLSDTAGTRHAGTRQGPPDCEWTGADSRRGFGEPESTGSGSSRMANTNQPIVCGQSSAWQQQEHECNGGHAVGLCDLRGEGSQGYGRLDHQYDSEGWQDSQRHGSEAGHWANATTGRFRDGKTRRIGRGVQPLAHGIPRTVGQPKSRLRGMARSASSNRKGRLKGYGNAIVPILAATFIRAFMETINPS